MAFHGVQSREPLASFAIGVLAIDVMRRDRRSSPSNKSATNYPEIIVSGDDGEDKQRVNKATAHAFLKLQGHKSLIYG